MTFHRFYVLLALNKIYVDKSVFIYCYEKSYDVYYQNKFLKAVLYDFSVPIFKDLPEETLIKISDVLEEVFNFVQNSSFYFQFFIKFKNYII